SFTAPVSYNITEVRTVSVQSINRQAGSTNPTSDSSVNFTVTFSEGVTGVAANQFTATKTNTVQTGTITVTAVSAAVYTVTVSGITGLGNVGLNFQDNGNVHSTNDNIGMTTGSFNGPAPFTITESANLFVQAIDFGPGGTSPTNASTVTFKVTFSSAVTNVAASQFTVVAGGSVASSAPVLTGSGKDYTITVNGITGAGTLGLNFQDDGTIRRASDNHVMTTSTFTGAVYTIVQGTQGSTDLDVAGLRFHVVGGGNFSTAGSLNSATGQVQVGFTPTGGNALTPLATLNGTVSIDTTTLNFSASGAVVAVIGGTTRTLFDNGVTNINIPNLINSKIAAGGGKSLTVAGSTFTLSSFGFTNTSTPTITLQGNAVLPKGISVRVDGNNEVDINSSGVSLSGATFSLTNSFTVAGVTFSADQLTVSYTTNGNIFALTGTAGVTIRDIGNMSVNFGNTGLVISNGSFTSLDATVNGSFTVKGVQIAANALHFTYAESTGQFSMSGGASVTVGGLDDSLSVTFGHGNTPGLVVTAGNLVSLDMTVNTQFHVAKVTVTATNLEFTYTASSSTFTLAGTAGFAISGIDDSLSVTFGHGSTPGLVITNGSLVSLDVTVNATFHVAKVTVTATNLEFTYNASTSTFTLAGTAGFTISGVDDSLSVTFGEAGSPGLVVTDGKLVSLDVTVNAQFHLKKVTITATDLRFTYVAVSKTFTLAGTAGFHISGVDDDLAVTFGHGSTPGLVISDGALVSLDVTVNATFNIKKVTITARDLEFTYVTATNQFTLTGTAGLTIKGTGNNLDLSITFGGGSHPGLVVTNGHLDSLDVIVNADFKVSKVTIFARNLEFTYTANTNTFTLAGTAGITVGNLGANLSITFGHDGRPGLVIVDGTLESLDMTVNAGFRVAQVLDVNVQNVEFTYTRSTNTFTLSGGVTVSPVGLSDLANIQATIGDAAHPGIVIQDGNLVSLHMQVNANIRVSALTVSGQLAVDYTQSTRTIIISGVGSIAVAGIGQLNVHLGGQGGTQGLVIVNGQITTFNMTIDTHIRLAGLELNGNLIMNYNSAARLFVMTGSVSLNIGSIGNVTATLGGNGSTGLVISNGSLVSLNMSATANFSVGPLGLNGTLMMSYQSQSSRFVMYGSAQGTFLGQSLFTVDIGNSSNPGLAISNGALQNLSVTLTGTFSILGVPLGHVSLTAQYDKASSRYFFSGTASVDLPDFVPDWLASILGGRTLASISVELNVIANNNHDSYFQAEASIFGVDFGFKKRFDGGLEFIGNPVLTTIANTVMTVVNAVVDAATAVWDWFSSWWGPLDGATIYYDPGFNFAFATDPQSTSGADGRFAPVVPQGATSGQLVLTGGIDRSTGLVNALRLTAPYNSRVVSPLTSILNQLMQQQGLSAGDAMTVENQSLGMPMTTNLLGESLVLAATGGDLVSARSFSREVEVGIIVHQVSSLLSGLPGAPSVAELSTDGFAALASIIAESGGQPLDLADPDLMTEIILRTAQRAALTLDPEVVDGAAAIMANVNDVIDTIPLNDSTTYLNRLLQVQTVAQGTIVPQLAQVAAGQLPIATVVANNTGDALVTQVNAASFGVLNVIGPTLSITPIISQAVGAGDPSTYEFQVYLSSPEPLTQPVSVHYATRDQTATAGHGDFDQTTGTLTWLPGDTAPKTISIPVYATNTTTPNRLFTVELTNPENAEIVNLAGIGNIAYSDFATSTSISTSLSHPQFGQAVTFTAIVANLDPQHTTPNQGTVTFYDGEQMLGSAPVSNGIARFTTDDLTAEVHSIRASYAGAILTAERYQSSTSSPLEEVVGQISQTITFPGVQDITTDAAPFVIDGFSSSGLPLTFKLISGAASLNGNILTPVAPGPVVLEADQDGDVNFTSATPLTRTFMITDSSNGLNDTAPIALNGIAKVLPGSNVLGQLSATDAENDPLTYGVGNDPENGMVVVNEDGSFEYTPADGFIGVDSFTFTANDGQLISNLATITVTVRDPNLPPVADDGTFDVDANATYNGNLSAVTGNDGALTFSQGSLHTQHGLVTIHPDGAFTYKPFQGFFGTDSFSFVANDGHLTSNAGTISITVHAVAPVAQNGTLNVQENASQNGTLSAAGGNGGSLTYSQGTVHAHHGLVTIQSNGTFTYTPSQGFAGTDSFSFVASDGQLTSNNGLVTITVQAVEDTPSFDLDVNQSVTLGTKTAVRLDSSASLTNVSPQIDFTHASILVSTFNAGLARDTLAILKKGAGVTLKGTKLVVNGVQVGTISGGKTGVPLRVTFTGGSQATVNTVLKAITAKAGKVKKGQPQNVRSIQIDVTASGETRSAVISAGVQ
ncbi:MAG: outer rane adhesin like protein, partial [Planctomycetaceae bacterium]|nr:outer rane adhesin like protein [Planctomycetaceae bacterium]